MALRKKHVYTAGFVFAVLLGYLLLWWRVSLDYEENVLRTIAKMEGSGVVLSYDNIEFSGFPFYASVTLVNPQFSAVPGQSAPQCVIDGSIKFSKKILSLSQTLYYRSSTDVRIYSNFFGGDIPETPVFYAKNLSGKLKAENLTQFASIQSYGWALTSQTVSGDDMKLTFQQDFEKNTTTVALESEAVRFGSNGAPAALKDLSFDALGARIKIPIIQKGINDLLTVAERIKAEKSGIDVVSVHVRRGELEALGSGNISYTLEEALPVAAFSLDIRGLQTGLDLLAQKNALPLMTTRMLGAFIDSMFAKETKDAAGKVRKYHNISLTFQDGQLSVGSFPVFSIHKPSRKRDAVGTRP